SHPSRGMVQHSTAATAHNPAATPSASEIDTDTSGPAMPDPTGMPAKLSAIDTAKARPNQAGAVRRCRSENSAMSIGPTASPQSTMPTTTAAHQGSATATSPTGTTPNPAASSSRAPPTDPTRPIT